MSNQNTVFYQKSKAVFVDFHGDEMTSDGGVVLLEKIEKKFGYINEISKAYIDSRNQSLIHHKAVDLFKQRIFGLVLGYQDCNDVNYLKNDPVISSILNGSLASQPTLSRFEMSVDRKVIYSLCESFVSHYINSLRGRKKIILDFDGTDDKTHGHQQLALFNGYYGHHMYHQLFVHDGETGQIVLPVLRPGNSHSNRWFVAILKRLVKKIRSHYPEIEIVIRADAGFSCAPFYKLANECNLKYTIGIASNSILKAKAEKVQSAVRHIFEDGSEKHQHFFNFQYQAQTWEQEQNCIAKVEWTGKGLNTRFVISNMDEASVRDIYFGFYVKRGESSENRIKEVKNMCFADRLSNHFFWPNFFRLILSSMAYEIFRLIKKEISQTKHEWAKKWQVDTIRLCLLKIGGTIKSTVRRVYYSFSKAFPQQKLFLELLQ
ncbi:MULTISPECIES: IS1380 family transposase [Persicobacter]|uniref:Transposase DDE domain-containing protein n=1 Tax=Persicobacter diffluens TaxID=981 RepID=A0AAN4W4Z0_9BACT|nr:IS1380 family transposase [Persicobacter sp. CCB-QB2]GJM59929.1 hypothetical protein PEDI_04810 [Persicobacter diffluens]GJM61397.1 hypothetical protein PEDI_19490 [Persicobacter diffluens]GJM64281.1 hypothetical protein PEDI_48330 [Persicobacter diffluens]GJM64924.1 hypothetical protein PEDI_54760 [Persicobacter diffluens]